MPFACGHLPFANAVEAVLAEAGVSVERSDWELHAGGSAHIVVNAGHMMSVRIAKNPTSGENVRRRTRALSRLPEFDFTVPRPLTPVIQDGRYTAVGMTWIPGAPRAPGPVNRSAARTPGPPSRGWTAPGSTGAGTGVATSCWSRCFPGCCHAAGTGRCTPSRTSWRSRT